MFLDKQDKQKAISILSYLDITNKITIQKIKSGIQCFNLIDDILQERNIIFENVYWCYRRKPPYVDKLNPSDIIIQGRLNEERKYLGFSLKSGKESATGKGTKQPKLNSYINSVLNIFGEQSKVEFYNQFNNLMVKLFENFVCTDFDSINDWNNYKKKNKDELANISLNDFKFRSAQQMIINFIVNLFNTNKQQFKEFFIQRCLGIMDPNSKQFKQHFFSNGFYVLKGIQNGETAKIITPNINDYLNVNPNNIEIYKDNKSVQSINIKINGKVYTAIIRTSDGKSCFELPNLKFVIQ